MWVRTLPRNQAGPLRVGGWGVMGALPPVLRGSPQRLLGALPTRSLPPVLRGSPQRLLGALSFGAIGKGSTVSSAAAGASAGASIGSAVPVIGTAIGALVGAAVGAIASAFNRQDQEVQNFNQAQQIADSMGPQAVLNIANKYLVLAGLFDLDPSQIKGNIPIYKKYGRLGEKNFVTDLMTRIYGAAQTGQISANDTVQSVFARLVQPWFDGFGYGPMSDHNANMINYIIMGMIAEYVNGLQNRWVARGGDYPFGNLPTFALPSAAPPPSQFTPAPSTPGYSSPYPAPTPAAQQTELQRYLSGAVPSVGDAITYARDAVTGNFVPIPAGEYGGQPSPGVWMVMYPTGQYTVQSGRLVPYTAPTLQSSVTPGTGSISVVTPVTALPTQTTGLQPVIQPPSITSSVGGGMPTSIIPATTAQPFPFSPDQSGQSVAPTVAPTAAGVGSELSPWVLGAAAIALLLATARPVGKGGRKS